MEGRLALPRPSTKGHLLQLTAIGFFAGCAFEVCLCTTGFYNVYSYKAAEKEAQSSLEQEDFWERVRSRREARARAGLLETTNGPPSLK